MVVHHLRRLRRAVPGRHRARRPHRRHAPLPGADRVVVPVRGRRDAEEPREQGQPVGDERPRPARSGPQDLDFEVAGARRTGEDPGRRRLPVLGRLRRRAGGPGEEDHPGVRRAAAHRRASSSRSSATGETCTGDPARRLGNEFLFQMLASRTSRRSTRSGATKIVATCPHCFNTLANEYPQLGGNYEVVHHTQLLGRLVERGPAHPGHADRPARHLPRPLLPGPAQQGLHAAARGARHRPRPAPAGDAPVQGARLLLRRRRRADVDGGEDRQADQRRARRRGARPSTRTSSPPPARSAW